MVFLVICKMKNILSKMKALGCSQHYTSFFRCSRADNSEVGGGIWPKFELIQAFMHVLVSFKNEDDSIKNGGARVVTTFIPDAQGQLTLQSLIQSG